MLVPWGILDVWLAHARMSKRIASSVGIWSSGARMCLKKIFYKSRCSVVTAERGLREPHAPAPVPSVLLHKFGVVGA